MHFRGGSPAENKSSLGDIDENWLMKYDKNKDGGISEKELRMAIREKGGWWPLLFSHWYAARCMAAADKNRDGVIRGDELNSLIEFAKKQLSNA
ncbi:hypothetical protein C2S52_022943 [Perilla frutescens var. hirtella]|uniref:EF-hand domain-containing protein n=1 Tax=Perilla frutescens var. hirtella TaxID=608512 RepID=A0AAD4P7P1_PERFH|nr:hypothetical protein C2S52_022943 [Perilla frutescens var. hirtella]KAH6782340.1 hypothetical protein C2S51_007633 [Perilla frutescens var. frutescens]KAH6828970.1 hypothetical protein C2S53_012367 [Perilla frutescens var. hirtella]